VARENKGKIFVSYSHHDERLVKPIAALVGLSAETVFLDVNSLKPGDDWVQEIKSAIKDSFVFILCWCCQSAESEYVAAEMKMALRDKTKKLVPVLLCSTALPVGFASKQWIDLRKAFKHDCIDHKDRTKARKGAVKKVAVKRFAKKAPAKKIAKRARPGPIIMTDRGPDLSIATPPAPGPTDDIEASSLARKIRIYFKGFAE
jgi:hypothetical protein